METDNIRPIEVQDDGKIIKMIDIFEIQCKKKSINKNEWQYYNRYVTREIANENIEWLRVHKASWNY